MVRTQHRSAWWSALVLAATQISGCYLVHASGDDRPPRDAGREIDAGRRDAGSPPDASRLPDAGSARCLGDWQVTSTLQLTEPPGDERPSDVEWTGIGYLVGFQSSNPDRDQSRFAQLVNFGAPLAEPQRVFGPPTGSFGSMGIAVWDDRVGATTWDETGCSFRRIAADGSGLADARRIDADGCVGLTATRGGFSLMDYQGGDSEVRFHRLGPDGGSIGRIPTLEIFRGDAYWYSRVAFVDDAQLLTVMRGGVAPSSAVAQRIDSQGLAIGAEMPLPPFVAASRIRSIETGRGVLLGWLEDEGGDPDSQERVIRLMRASNEGRVLGEAFTLPGLRAYRDGGWSMTRVRDEIFVVYVEPEVGDRFGRETVIRAQRIDGEGVPLGEPLALAEAVFGRRVIARTNGRRIFVAFAANAGSSTEVFTVELDCVFDL